MQGNAAVIAARTKTKAGTNADHAGATNDARGGASVAQGRSEAAADDDNWNHYPKSFVDRRWKVLVEDLALPNARKTKEGTEVPGSHDGGVALARAAANRMDDVRLIVGSDIRWSNARAKAEFRDLAQALLLTEDLWRTVRLGLAAANADNPSPWQKATLCQSAKIARKALRKLKEVRPEFGRLWRRLPEDHEAADCVQAWREALPLIEAATKARPRVDTEIVVRDVINNNPALGERLRLDDAIKNAHDDVFDIIRSAWGKGKSGTRKAPRKVAFELTRWACGMTGAKAVQHACDRDRGARKIDV
jgi:hypothetical protein